MIFRSGCWLF